MRRQLARAAVQLLRVGAPEASTPAASCRWAAEPSAFQSLLQAASSCRHHGTPGSAAGGAAARLPLRALATQTAGRPATPAEKVELSDSAVQRLQDLQRKSSEPVVLRLTVEGGGCSGFQYEFSIDSSAKNGDRCAALPCTCGVSGAGAAAAGPPPSCLRCCFLRWLPFQAQRGSGLTHGKTTNVCCDSGCLSVMVPPW